MVNLPKPARRVSCNLKLIANPMDEGVGDSQDENFLMDLSNQEWELLDKNFCVDRMWEIWKIIFLSVLDKHINSIKTEYLKNSYSGAKLWNSLPNELRVTESLAIFNKNV